MNLIAAALASAGLFGASTPLAKLLLGELPPLLLAGLHYLGSGLGLVAGAVREPHRHAHRHERMVHSHPDLHHRHRH
jgi:hypothetical protein